MNYRFMRVVVFFDLPMQTSKEKAEYASFRKFLIKNGFIQMQYSVYTKLAINKTVSTSIKNLVKANTPKSGLVQMLEVTENQFCNIEYLVGSKKNQVLDSSSRVVRYD